MTRKYVHLLGYSSAEHGIKELFTNDTFDIGSVDVETMEQEFDDFTISIPMSSALKVKPVNNEAWVVKTRTLKYDDVVIKLLGDRTLYVGEYLWLENERIKITSTNVGGSVNTYGISRAQNGSIAILHSAYSNVNGQGDLVATIQRTSPIGMIVKVFDTDATIAYGQINSVTLTNSAVTDISCTHIYKQMEVPVVIPRNLDVSMAIWVGIVYRLNEFYSLLDEPNVKINPNFIGEVFQTNDYYMIYENAKDAFTQIMNINNRFLKFDNGRFSLVYIGRTSDKPAESLKLSDHLTLNDGVIEFTVVPPYSSAKINDGVNEEYSIDASDSNFSRSYTMAKTIDIDLSAVRIYGADSELPSIARGIAIDKLWFLNNITEKLSISSYATGKHFKIGSYYKFVDIFKYVSFYDTVTDNIFLCTGYEDGRVNFIRTPVEALGYVAPSIIVKKIDNYEFEMVDLDLELDGFANSPFKFSNQLYTTLADLSAIKNTYTDTLIWEPGDKITMIDMEGVVSQLEIDSIGITSFVTTADVGAIDDLFIMTIQSDVSFVSLATKNKVYLYEGNSSF